MTYSSNAEDIQLGLTVGRIRLFIARYFSSDRAVRNLPTSPSFDTFEAIRTIFHFLLPNLLNISDHFRSRHGEPEQAATNDDFREESGNAQAGISGHIKDQRSIYLF